MSQVAFSLSMHSLMYVFTGIGLWSTGHLVEYSWCYARLYSKYTSIFSVLDNKIQSMNRGQFYRG